MHHPRSEDKVLSLTSLYFQILTALAGGPSYGYAIGSACRLDSDKTTDSGMGAIYAALTRLQAYGYISRDSQLVTAVLGNARQLYELTSTGRLVLGWEADRLSQLVALAKSRLAVVSH